MKPSMKYKLTEELRKEEFDKYFKLIKKFGIDTGERYNQIKEYYSKGLLRFNIS